MRKKFNDVGLCIPEKHYMADTSEKIHAILRMVEDGSYFVISRPRQYGKTTTLYLLERELQERQDYLPIFISFEGLDAATYETTQRFIRAFIDELAGAFEYFQEHDLLEITARGRTIATLYELSSWIKELIEMAHKPLVLMIDEVDKSSNNQLFLDFLAMLRKKYLAAARGRDATFHSVILSGLHDIKSLKLKLRPEEERKYNSPWNIAVDFTVEMSLQPREIGSMLTEYVAATGVTMDIDAIAGQLYDYTSGYPFLVSKLCKLIDENIMQASRWLAGDIEEAINRILQLQNTNFDSLIKNLENNPDLYQIVEKIVLLGEYARFNQYSHIINQGFMYGILIRRDDAVDIHNRIYREHLYNYMATNLHIKSLLDRRLGDYTFQDNYRLPDGGLDMIRVASKFQEFMKQEYSRRDTAFIERNGRLIFLAFLRPILNGRGYEFKEPQISEEKRLDIAVTYSSHKYVIELKIWRGDAAHQKGLRQLRDYLDRTGLDSGYLVIFDFTQQGQKTWKQEQLQVEGKDIFAVWV